jgi:hypothetical protein
MMNSAYRLISSMVSAVQQRPMLFNGATGGSLFAASDAIAQEMEQEGLAVTHDKKEGFNNRRFLSTVAIGVFIGVSSIQVLTSDWIVCGPRRTLGPS